MNWRAVATNTARYWWDEGIGHRTVVWAFLIITFGMTSLVAIKVIGESGSATAEDVRMIGTLLNYLMWLALAMFFGADALLGGFARGIYRQWKGLPPYGGEAA